MEALVIPEMPDAKVVDCGPVSVWPDPLSAYSAFIGMDVAKQHGGSWLDAVCLPAFAIIDGKAIHISAIEIAVKSPWRMLLLVEWGEKDEGEHTCWLLRETDAGFWDACTKALKLSYVGDTPERFDSIPWLMARTYAFMSAAISNVWFSGEPVRIAPSVFEILD